MNDGDEKKDLEGGEKDDITYADLDDNAPSSGELLQHVWSLKKYCKSKNYSFSCKTFIFPFLFQETEPAA